MTAPNEALRLTREDHKDVMRDLVANIRDPELDAEALGNWLRCYGHYVAQAEAAAKARLLASMEMAEDYHAAHIEQRSRAHKAEDELADAKAEKAELVEALLMAREIFANQFETGVAYMEPATAEDAPLAYYIGHGCIEKIDALLAKHGGAS